MSVGKERRHQEHLDIARMQPALRGKGKRANHASSRPAPGCLSLLCTQNKTRLFDNKGDKTRQRARSGRGTQTSVTSNRTCSMPKWTFSTFSLSRLLSGSVLD